MKKCILALVLPAILLNCTFLSVAFGEDYKSVLAVINHYKNQTVKINDLDADARDYFINSEGRKFPGIVRADFNGDGKDDVVILTKGTLLFFICNELCKQVKSENYDSFAGFQYIIPIKKGQRIEQFGGFDSQPSTPSVLLENAAVHLIHYGKASIAYYWDPNLNNFNAITTGD
jgi:hypothetical protein